MLTVITSGLPLSAKDVLTEAMDLAFGKRVVSIEELPKDLLRSRVRLASRNTNYILVVLDGVSTDTCKDIENGLYSSDKFFSYQDDTGFVLFLNKKFDISMEVPEEEEDLHSSEVHLTEASSPEGTAFSRGESEESARLIKKLKGVIKDRESIIFNLNCQIKELEERIKEFDFYGGTDATFADNEELTSLKSENAQLKRKVVELNEAKERGYNDSSSEQIEELTTKVEILTSSKALVEKKLTALTRDYETAMSELSESRVSYSKQSGVLSSKERQLAELQLQEDKWKSGLDWERKFNEVSLELSKKSLEVESKERDITRYLKEIDELRLRGSNEGRVRELQADVDSLEQEKVSLQSRLKELETELSSKSSVEDELSSLKQRNEELQNRIKEDDESLTILNKEKLELQSQVEVLQKTSSSDSDIESVMEELVDFRNKYASLSNSAFGKIASSALPKSSPVVHLTRKGAVFNNLRFAFSGSAESRKGTYKCLLEEFKATQTNVKFLIVDLVSETSIDYVFEIKKVKSGLEWFRTGGSLDGFLSQTCLPNTYVLSMGLSYINDSYFLSINWERRLTELESSGYKVVIYCGDLSNVVGRVLHESFADLAASIIYVQGNAVGSRTVITNLKGISNSKCSMVAYFEFNPQMKRFLDIVAKTNKYEILKS